MKRSKIELAIFYCHNQTPTIKELLGKLNGSGMMNSRKVALPCSGKMEVSYLLKALESGADGVAIVGCPEGECDYLTGSTRAKGRVRYVRKILGEIGLGEDRVRRFVLRNASQQEPMETLIEWVERIKAMGAIHDGSRLKGE